MVWLMYNWKSFILMGRARKIKEGTNGEEGHNISSKDIKKDKPKPTAYKKVDDKPQNGQSVSFKSPGTYSIWGTAKSLKNNYGVQLGSFSELKNAISNGKKATKKGLAAIFIQAGYSNHKKVFRLIYGDFTEQEARINIKKVKSKGYKGAFVKKHL